jgi:hypothetical protein
MRTDEIAAEIYAQFQRYLQRKRNSGLRIVPPLVDVVATSLDDDLKRFEDYHGSEHSEEQKKPHFSFTGCQRLSP